MATFRTYKCTVCGYTVQTEPEGHYSVMSGECYNFKCGKCKEIISLSADRLAEERFFITCPKCGAEELSVWNPIEGHCPKCGALMKEDTTAPLMLVD